MTDLFTPKDSPLRSARLTGFREALRACLQEVSLLNVARAESIAKKDEVTRRTCEDGMRSAWRIYKRVTEMSHWPWNEETGKVGCECKFEVVDSQRGVEACVRCGTVRTEPPLPSPLSRSL